LSDKSVTFSLLTRRSIVRLSALAILATGSLRGHLARRGSLAAFCRLAKPLNLLNPSLAVGQVVSSKNG
jgi:hypothetical protein